MSERIAMWIAQHLPQGIAYWAYIRVAMEGTNQPPLSSKNPTEQRIDEPLRRWVEGRQR